MTNREFIEKFVPEPARQFYLEQANEFILDSIYGSFGLDIMECSFEFEKHGGVKKWRPIVDAANLNYTLFLKNN